ncbi:VTT domain-containing protein [Candidatus Methylospira mobilis]|nr:VTT domain-containing protein [Candidatus Methylospira mobilis]WNV05639.1 VTT domain-containing protein [Candidatus Methylospira mobilis]
MQKKSSFISILLKGGLLLILLGLGALVYFSPIRVWLAQGALIKAQLAQFGMAAPAVFTLCTAMLVAIGVPRLLLCSLAGVIFGFAWAITLTQIGTVLGAYCTFLFMRLHGRDYAFQHFPRLRRFSRKLEGHGLMSVLIARQLPVNGFYNDIILALSPVSHRSFLAGTFIGFLPQGLTACLIGAGLIQADTTQGIQYMALALILSLLLGLGLRRWISVRKASYTLR